MSRVTLPAYSSIRRVARRAATGADAARHAYASGRVPDEPRLVERALTEIEHAVDGARIHGLSWIASSMTSIGRSSAEATYGADFVGVFEVHLPDFEVTKGFLAQAKLVDHGALGTRERQRLRDQCQKMLAHTPDAFVWLFSSEEIRIVPAISVTAGDNDPASLYYRGVQRFFEEHFACFIGDGAVSLAQARGPVLLPELVQR